MKAIIGQGVIRELNKYIRNKKTSEKRRGAKSTEKEKDKEKKKRKRR